MMPPLPLSAREVLVFEHIPKTAGSTLGGVLQRRFGSGLFSHTNVRSPQRRLNELLERIRAGRPPRAIAAHLGYGFHERLPGDLRYAHLTFLRRPIERTVSSYYYALQRGRVKADTALTDYCSSEQAGTLGALGARAWNLQTGFLGGLRVRQILDGHPYDPEDYDEALLDRAKAALDAFPVLGLTERFEESLLLIGRTFGWPLHALRFVPKNRGRLRPRQRVLTDEERAALEAANRLDLALYRHAEERFEHLLAERVPDLEEQLRALRQFNLLYRPLAPIEERLRALSLSWLRQRRRRGVRHGGGEPPGEAGEIARTLPL